MEDFSVRGEPRIGGSIRGSCGVDVPVSISVFTVDDVLEHVSVMSVSLPVVGN